MIYFNHILSSESPSNERVGMILATHTHTHTHTQVRDIYNQNRSRCIVFQCAVFFVPVSEHSIL